ncbi:MAG: CBS domain-containing protein [Sandaracinaceae bacterium]
MKKNEPIKSIMSDQVFTVHTGQKLSDARKLMVQHGMHHVPVVSGDRLVGLLAASDILGLSVEGVGSDQRAMDAYLDHQFSIEDQMIKDVRTLEKDGTIRDAAELLADGKFHAVPILDDGALAGIVTTTDLVRYLLVQLT